MLKFGGSSDSTSSIILYELESSDILAGGIEIEGVTVVKFRLDERRSNGECTRVVKSIAYASEVTNLAETSFRNGRNVFGEGKVRVKDETKIACKRIRFEDSIWGDEDSWILNFSLQMRIVLKFSTIMNYYSKVSLLFRAF